MIGQEKERTLVREQNSIGTGEREDKRRDREIRE